MNTKEKLIEKIKSIHAPKILKEIDRWITSIVEVASAETYIGKKLNAVREGYAQFNWEIRLNKKRQTEFLTNG